MKSIRTSSALVSRLSTTTPTTTTCSRTALAPLSTTATRSFFQNPFAAQNLQTLTASRILPYDAKTLFAIVADIQSYHKFLPFCVSSNVTKHSSPDADAKTWPEEAELVVGYKDVMRESFYSRVYCAPRDLIVESVSGETDTSLPAASIAHHTARPSPDQDPARNATTLTRLRSRWTLRPFPYKPGPMGDARPQEAAADVPPRMQTEVALAIDYMFANPLYTTLSAAAAPKVAEKMIEAFESRAREMLDRPAATSGTAKFTGAVGVSGPGAKA